MADEEFDELLEQSSLGSPGARQLRARASRDQVALTRRIADLRNRMVHGDQEQARTAAAALLQLLREHNYQASADGEREDVLDAGTPVEEDLPPWQTLTVPKPVRAVPSLAPSRPAGGRDSAVSVSVMLDVEGQEARRLLLELRSDLGEVGDVVPVLATLPQHSYSRSDVVLSVATTSAALPAVFSTVVRWLKYQRHQPRVALTINSLAIESLIIEVTAAMSDEDLSRLDEYLNQISDL